MKSICLWHELPSVSEEHIQTVEGYVYAVLEKVLLKNIWTTEFEIESLIRFLTSKMLDTKGVRRLLIFLFNLIFAVHICSQKILEKI